jgi:hypothetical protein
MHQNIGKMFRRQWPRVMSFSYEVGGKITDVLKAIFL